MGKHSNKITILWNLKINTVTFKCDTLFHKRVQIYHSQKHITIVYFTEFTQTAMLRVGSNDPWRLIRLNYVPSHKMKDTKLTSRINLIDVDDKSIMD